MLRLALVAALVLHAAAQNSSSACTVDASIVGNKDAADCLAIPYLIPVVKPKPDTSIVAPLNTWLGHMCKVPACSNATLTAIATSLSTCVNISSGDLQMYYPTIRKIFCLKTGDNFCINDTLTKVEAVYGPLTLTNIFKLVNDPPATLSSFNGTCTDCNKESYNIWVKEFPSTVTASNTTSLASHCGASFVDGSTPSGITQSANTSASVAVSATGPALSLLDTLTNSVIMAIGASSFIALSTVYATLI